MNKKKRKYIAIFGVVLCVCLLNIYTVPSQVEGAGGGSWSFNYGSSTTFGAWIGQVKWQGTTYICYANIPEITIDGNTYQIPADFTTVNVGWIEYSTYYLAYMMYTKNIGGTTHDMEILWKFQKTAVSGAGEIEVRILLSIVDSLQHTASSRVRVDFDINGASGDEVYVYGTTGWNQQKLEAVQFATPPTDSTWGMKVKQQDYTGDTIWGGIKAWSTSETNYLLRWHSNEYRGNPSGYVNGENIDMKDDTLWTTASIAGVSPLTFGPTIYVY